MFTFGPYRLDPHERKVLCAGEIVPLTPKAFDVLLLLVENANRLVEKSEILARVWPQTFVEESTLSQNIFTLRKTLSEHAAGAQFIETVPKHGYRLTCLVTRIDEPGDHSALEPPIPVAAPRFAARTNRLWWVALLAVVGLSAVWTRHLWFNRPPAIRGLAKLTFDSKYNSDPDISPDARFIVYTSDRDSGESEYAGYANLWRQDLPRGSAIRLTRDKATHTEPDISPDGTTIVFRSSERGGVLATVPAAGGAMRVFPTLSRARGPRFSPRMPWIAYWIAGDDETLERGSVYVTSLAQQEPDKLTPPSRLFAEFAHAAQPVWSDDGKMILIFGTWRSGDPAKEYDAWVAKVDDGYQIGVPIKTGLFPLLKRQGVFSNLTERANIFAGAWSRGYLHFSAKAGDACNLWRVALPSPGFLAQTPAERMTNGSGCETGVREASNGAIVFSNHEISYQIHSIGLDPVSGVATGEFTRLTAEAGVNMRPSVSADGKVVAWESRGRGADQVRLLDLRNGQERQLGRSLEKLNPGHPLMSPDGRFVAYRIIEDHPQAIYREDLVNGEVRKICADCGAPEGWVGHGEKLVYHTGGAPVHLGLLDVPSGESRDWLVHPSYSLYGGEPRLSASGDGWVTFYADNGLRTRQIFVAGVQRFQPAPPHTWIAITDGATWDVDPAWSADGNVLYFLSQRDGSRCIWGQRLDSATKRPAGDAFGVRHFHSVTQSLLLSRSNRGGVGLSARGGRLFLSLEQHTASLWMTQLQ